MQIGLWFFIWIGVVSVFLIAQFWSYANDLYSEEQGKRLFGLIAIGGSLGAVVGPEIAKLGDTYTLLAIAAALLVITLVLLNLVEKLARKAAKPDDKTADAPIDGENAFSLILKDRYLLFFGALVLISQLCNTNGEFILGSVVRAHAAHVFPNGAPNVDHDRRELIKAFYSTYFLWVNVVGFVIQAFFVSRVLQKFGVRRAVFIMPVVALGASALIGAFGGMYLIRAAKVAENGVDYSMQNTVRQALWLPTSRPVKYKAKAAIDTFVVRFADTISALLVWGLVHELGMGATTMAWVDVGALAVSLFVCVGIVREHKKISRDTTEHAAV
jgi:AAA family ATP:ADP antiporter